MQTIYTAAYNGFPERSAFFFVNLSFVSYFLGDFRSVMENNGDGDDGGSDHDDDEINGLLIFSHFVSFALSCLSFQGFRFRE